VNSKFVVLRDWSVKISISEDFNRATNLNSGIKYLFYDTFETWVGVVLFDHPELRHPVIDVLIRLKSSVMSAENLF